jgi:hypothetical protein
MQYRQTRYILEFETSGDGTMTFKSYSSHISRATIRDCAALQWNGMAGLGGDHQAGP